GQHDDAGVVLPQAQLGGWADHAGRHPAVGLTGADLETAGQDPAGQDGHDQVALGEVACAADDLLGLAGAVGLADVDAAGADGLLEIGALLDLQATAENERAFPASAEGQDGLDRQAWQGQTTGKVACCDIGGQLDARPQPGHGNSHQTTLPNAEEKRMSPSTMSRMSRTPCANISVRSMPRPKAQPL